MVTNTLKIQVIFDSELVKSFPQFDIDRAVTFCDKVFKTNQIDVKTAQIYPDRRVAFDFSPYKIAPDGPPPVTRREELAQQGWLRMFDDMADPNTYLGQISRALLTPRPADRLLMVICATLHKSGMGKARGIYRPNNPSVLDRPFVWVSEINAWLFLHEIGHIFGGEHCNSVGGEDPDSPCPDTLRVGDYKTMMAKSGGTLLHAFSDPRLNEKLEPISSGGNAIGNETHNNAAAIDAGLKAWFARPKGSLFLKKIAATQIRAGFLQLSAVGDEGYVFERQWDVVVPDRWREFQGLAHPAQGPITDIAVVTPTWGVNNTRTFGLDPTGGIYELDWTEGRLSWWFKHGDPGMPLTSIAAVAWTINEFCVYVVGDGHVKERKCSGGVWNDDWYDINRPVVTRLIAVAAVCPTIGLNAYKIYGVGENGTMYERSWERNGWNEWHDINRPSIDVRFIGVAAASFDLGAALGLYGVGDDGNVYERWFDGQWWNQWSNHGCPDGVKLMSIAATSTGLNVRNLYATGDNGRLYARTFDNGWSDWTEVPA